MATITEDYVSFEIAKLLKEKGFPQDPNICNTAYTLRGKLSNNAKSFAHNFAEFNKCGIKPMTYSMAPTLQMAMKWLREVHNLCLFVIPATIDKTFRTGYALYPQCDSKWEWCASKNDRSKATFGFNVNRKYCDSYEEACEAAIKYCLENLINKKRG